MKLILQRVGTLLLLLLLVALGASWMLQSIPPGERAEKARAAARPGRINIPRDAEIPWRHDALAPKVATAPLAACPWSGRRLGARVEIPAAAVAWVRDVTKSPAPVQVAEAMVPPGWAAAILPTTKAKQ